MFKSAANLYLQVYDEFDSLSNLARFYNVRAVPTFLFLAEGEKGELSLIMAITSLGTIFWVHV